MTSDIEQYWEGKNYLLCHNAPELIASGCTWLSWLVDTYRSYDLYRLRQRHSPKIPCYCVQDVSGANDDGGYVDALAIQSTEGDLDEEEV